MDPKFPGKGYFRKSKKLFDSAQCWLILDLRTFQFPTPRSVRLFRKNPKVSNTARSRTLCRLTLRAVGYLRENEFFSKIILACLSGAQMGQIHETQNIKNSRDTAPLKGAWNSKIDPLWCKLNKCVCNQVFFLALRFNYCIVS